MPTSTSVRNPNESPLPVERAASVVAGSLLLLPLLRRRSLWNCGTATLGGALIYNGILGTVSVTDRFGVRRPTSPVSIRRSITIGRTATELSSMWRSPDVIARVMQPFGRVKILGTDHLRWIVEGPARQIEVECVLAEERPGELVHWKSLPTTSFRVDQYMHFKPAPRDQGTEATLVYEVDLSNAPAGGALRAAISFLEGSVSMAIGKVLHNFKSLAETGEIPTLERNPSARANGKANGDLI
jgi:uncharacterized membrane protein